LEIKNNDQNQNLQIENYKKRLMQLTKTNESLTNELDSYIKLLDYEKTKIMKENQINSNNKEIN